MILGNSNLSSHQSVSAVAWDIDMVNADDAWLVTRGVNAVIAIIDSGLDIDHPDILPRIWNNTAEIAGNSIDDDNNGYIDDMNGWDFRDNDNTVDGPSIHWHGTAVAGVVARFAPDAKIMPIRLLDNNLNIFPSDLGDEFPDAINYAVDNGANVIVMALRITVALPQVLLDAFDNALTNDVTLVAVTGNDNQELIRLPGKEDSVIAIGSVDSSKQRATWTGDQGSNWGAENEFVAPGTDILTLNLGGGNRTESGTSFSAPIVAAGIALLYSVRPSITPAEIRLILQYTALDLGATGRDDIFGYGLPDFMLAVQSVSDSTPAAFLSQEQIISASNASHGTLSLFFQLSDNGGIASCETGYRWVSTDPDSSWNVDSVCSGLPHRDNSIVKANVSLPVAGSVIQYFVIFRDFAGNNASAGTKDAPILVETGLEEIPAVIPTESTESTITTTRTFGNITITNPINTTPGSIIIISTDTSTTNGFFILSFLVSFVMLSLVASKRRRNR